MTLPPLQEFFTEAEAREHVSCPNGRTATPPLKCEGHTCGAWRWKHTGLDPERVEGPVGFCGVGPRP